MNQRRNRRAGVEDLWTKRDGAKSARHGIGKRWRARYVDNLGEEHTKAFTRKIDAQAWLDSQTTALGTNTHIDPHVRVTVDQLADRFEAGLGHLSAKSLYELKSVIKSRVRPKWGRVYARDILPSDVNAWVAGMVNEGLSGSLVRKCVGTLRRILDVGVSDRVLATNAAANVQLPKDTKKHKAVFLSPVQLHALSTACGDYGVLVELLGICGLRWGEATALQVGDLDTKRQRLHVTKAWKDVAGKLELGETKTGRDRAVPLPPSLASQLESLTRGRSVDELIFSAPKGGPLRIRNFTRQVFKPGVFAVDSIPNEMWIYDLRHTAASLAIQSGANIKAVQALLGHSTATMTLDRYGHLFPDDLGALAAALENTAY